jgi:hypothetical protein
MEMQPAEADELYPGVQRSSRRCLTIQGLPACLAPGFGMMWEGLRIVEGGTRVALTRCDVIVAMYRRTMELAGAEGQCINGGTLHLESVIVYPCTELDRQLWRCCRLDPVASTGRAPVALMQF